MHFSKSLYVAMGKGNWRKLWSDVKESISGSERDFTDIPMGKAILLLAVPMVLEMVMESVFAVVDIFFVSKLGADAVAAVGLTESVMTLVYAVAFGLGLATTALVSRRVGEKKPKEAARQAVQAIITALAVSALIAVPGVVFSDELLLLMGASTQLVENYGNYAAIMLGANGIVMLLFVCNAVFRGAGDAAMAMRVLCIGNLVNIVLDPLLIFGIGPFPEMGVAGAAVATNIGRGLAVLYQLYVLFWGKARVDISKVSFKPSFKHIRHLLNISLGGIAQSLIATLSWIFMMRLISRFGSSAVAGYTIAIRIIVFALLPSWGLSNAASTLAGQNLGANRPERAEKAVWSVARINFICMGLIGLVLIIWPRLFFSVFTGDQAIIDAGIPCLRIVSYGFAFYAAGMVMTQAFNGAGDTRTPTWINIIAFWIIEIPLAWLLSVHLEWNQHGVYYGIVIAESSLTVIALFMFMKGNWKKQQI
ncbi:MAG: MATE family efflux transporter [Breznakibacter sp.]